MTSTFWEAAARAAASTSARHASSSLGARSAIELAALRLHDGVLQGRVELAEHGNVCEETWAELDRRAVDLVNVLPKETLPERGKTLRGGPPAFGRRERIAGAGQAPFRRRSTSKRVPVASGVEDPVSSDSGLKSHSVGIGPLSP